MSGSACLCNGRNTQIHQNDAGKSTNDAPFLALLELVAKGENTDGSHTERLQSCPGGHHKSGIEVLHSKCVELLEHTEHYANSHRVCENLPRKGKGVLLFFACVSTDDVIPQCKDCRRDVRECQKGDVGARNLCGFCFAKQFDDARPHRGAHHCGKREEKPAFALLFFFLLDVEEHRKDQEKHAHNVGEIQGLAKGERTIKNDKKGTEIANENGERHGPLFERLRIKNLIEEREQCAQNGEPKALPRQECRWENDNERECHKEEQHCVEKHAICSVFEKLSARAPLQGHLGATQKRHYQNNEKLQWVGHLGTPFYKIIDFFIFL